MIASFRFLIFMSTVDNQSARPTTLCPVCRSIQEKNSDRHLNTHFEVLTRAGRNEKQRAKDEASRRIVQELRECNIGLLPPVFQEALKRDHKVMHDFKRFLDHVGVTVPLKEPQEPEEPSKKRKTEEVLEEDLEVNT